MKTLLNNKIPLALLIMTTLFIILLLAACQKKAQEEQYSLYFREDWKEIPAETPVTQEHVNNPDLTLFRHGPAEAKIKKSHHDKPADDPYYIWNGECEDMWALSLQKKNSTADLSRGGLIRWRTRQQGTSVLHVVLGLEDGTWLVSEQGTGTTPQWTVSEMAVDTLKWRQLDIPCIGTGEIVDNPDLKSVKNVGFTDLMKGGGSPQCARIDWIEVYTK